MGAGTNTMAYSYDGITFYGLGTSFFTTAGNGIAFSPELNTWVAVGEGTNTILWSNDGQSWATVTTGASILSAGYCVAWSSTASLFVAGGAAGTGRIAYSSDGKSWTVNTQSAISTAVSDIAYGRNSGVWVAVGYFFFLSFLFFFFLFSN